MFDKIPNAVFVVGEMQKEVLDKLDLVNTSGKTANELLFGDFDFLWKLTFIIAIDSVFLLLLLFPVLYMTFGKGRKGERENVLLIKELLWGRSIQNIFTE